MASGLIHMCVAKELNKYLRRNEEEILLGSIAPDLAKLVDISKKTTHFAETDENIPNMDIFLNQYKKYLKNDFVMGYYIHLYTDYIWFNLFIPNLFKDGKILKLNNRTINYNEDKLYEYIYDDYSSINKELLKQYDIKMNILKENSSIKNIIKELPIDKLGILIKKQKQIIKESEEKESILFDTELINNFIEFSVNDILSNIDNLNKD